MRALLRGVLVGIGCLGVLAQRQSFFLFGPRGVGKTAWLRARFPDALAFDLLESETYTRLLAAPSRLADQIPAAYRGWVVLDEIQRLPDLLNEVHRLIETRRLRFVMTGSSARKLRRRGVNLLAGGALTRFMHPLTASSGGTSISAARSDMGACRSRARSRTRGTTSPAM